MDVTRYGFSLVFSYLIVHQCICDVNFCLMEENDTFDLTIKNPWVDKKWTGTIVGVEWRIYKYGQKSKKLIERYDEGSRNKESKIYDNRSSFFDTWGLKFKKITPKDSGRYSGFFLSNGHIYNYSIKVNIIDIPKLQNEKFKITPIETGDSVHQLTCGQDWQAGPVSLIQWTHLNDPSQKMKSFIQHDGLWFFRVPENKSHNEYACSINTTSLCDICQVCNSKQWQPTMTELVLLSIGFFILITIGVLVFWYFTNKYQKGNITATERDEKSKKTSEEGMDKSQIKSSASEIDGSSDALKETEEGSRVDKFKIGSLFDNPSRVSSSSQDVGSEID